MLKSRIIPCLLMSEGNLVKTQKFQNPKNGKLIYVPEKNKIRFKASKKLNKKIND